MPTNTKHTPGPWRVIRLSEPRGQIQIATQGAGVGYSGLLVATLGNQGEHTEANAVLMAKAPELLAALRTCADWLARSARVDDREQAEDARAVIAKATGG